MTLEQLYPDHIAKLKHLYQSLIQQHGYSGVLIDAGCPHPVFLDDYHYPFKTNPHFKAWCPLTDHAHSLLLITENARPKLFYFQAQDYWHQPPEPPSGYWLEQVDVEVIEDRKAALKTLTKTFINLKELVYVGEEIDEMNHYGIDTVNPKALLNALHYHRAYKSDYEKYCILKANQIAVYGHLAAEMAFREGASEFEIQQAYLIATKHREQHLPYGNIVGLNQHAAILHYQHYQHHHYPESQRKTLLIDAGAQVHGYAADITRTYAFADGEFKALIQAMDQAQLAIIDAISPGSSYVDLHIKTHHLIAGVLAEFSVITQNPEDAVHSGLTSTFLPHGLGHLLGLQVHDPAGHQQDPEGTLKAPPSQYPFLRLTRPIETHQVFTIEPGLYFIPQLLNELKTTPLARDVNWQKVEQFMPYGGIRIEDNICVEPEKIRNFTREAFAEHFVS